MIREEKFMVHFAAIELQAIYGSFNNIGYVPDFEVKVNMEKEYLDKWMDAIRPVEKLMLNIRLKEILPSEHKKLRDGYTIYWDETSSSVIFENQNKQRIVYQPENGKEYFDSLTAMEFTVEDKGPVSILMHLSLFELKALLSLVRETYTYLTEEWSVNEFFTRTGVKSVDVEALITRLQKEVERYNI